MKCPYIQVVFIRRFNNVESIPLGACKCGVDKLVVFIYLYIREVFRTGLSVPIIVTVIRVD